MRRETLSSCRVWLRRTAARYPTYLQAYVRGSHSRRMHLVLRKTPLAAKFNQDGESPWTRVRENPRSSCDQATCSALHGVAACCIVALLHQRTRADGTPPSSRAGHSAGLGWALTMRTRLRRGVAGATDAPHASVDVASATGATTGMGAARAAASAAAAATPKRARGSAAGKARASQKKRVSFGGTCTEFFALAQSRDTLQCGPGLSLGVRSIHMCAWHATPAWPSKASHCSQMADHQGACLHMGGYFCTRMRF
jgi:hypothetical protein